MRLLKKLLSLPKNPFDRGVAVFADSCPLVSAIFVEAASGLSMINRLVNRGIKLEM